MQFIHHGLKAPGFQPLKLKCDHPVSSLCLVSSLVSNSTCAATLRDLKEVNPWVHSGFLQLLEATPEDLDAYGLVFQASQEVFGEVQTVDLVPGGENRPVTTANRREYVDLYVEWYLVSSIQSQFGAFHRWGCTS
jgi:E3 ubiquitin-protein ligase HECTD2